MISIALDGPSGAGKSTVAKKCAERFGFKYSFTREGFFLDEGYAGVQFDEEDLKDMQVLELAL